MIILSEAAATTPEINWNIVVQYTVGICVLLAALGAIWDRVRKNFASKEEVDILRYEIHEIRIHQATVEKLNGKLDQVLLAIERRKGRSND